MTRVTEAIFSKGILKPAEDLGMIALETNVLIYACYRGDPRRQQNRAESHQTPPTPFLASRLQVHRGFLEARFRSISNGTIAITSTPSEGTRIEVRVPLRQSPSST